MTDQHDHDHDHDQDHSHTHASAAHDDHEHGGGIFGWLFHGHKHEGAQIDSALEASTDGIRALKISLIGLLATALFQAVIAYWSGSAGLLADTIHNFSDALTAIPLWLAFVLGRRQANQRYTYGYGRAEDLAGVAVVVMIALSAGLAAYESLIKLWNPQPIGQVGWVVAAAIIGALGNEIVAQYRIRTGQRIGSAALDAAGQHQRVDLAGSVGRRDRRVPRLSSRRSIGRSADHVCDLVHPQRYGGDDVVSADGCGRAGADRAARAYRTRDGGRASGA